jgi:hypothetical protein
VTPSLPPTREQAAAQFRSIVALVCYLFGLSMAGRGGYLVITSGPTFERVGATVIGLMLVFLPWLLFRKHWPEDRRIMEAERTARLSETKLAPGDPSLDAELLRLVEAGQMIDAIRHCRLKTGLGLKEAKDYVEALQRPRPS